MSSTPLTNIVLIGFMGSGKSTIGRELFDLVGFQLLDTDHLFEQRYRTSIREFFAAHGEEAFRDAESAILQECLQNSVQRTIISTGGGAVIREKNRAILRQLGYCVWLQAPASYVHERTSRNQDRPLLQGENPEKIIADLLAKREPWYRETAHMNVDIRQLSPREIAIGILESARYFFSGSI